MILIRHHNEGNLKPYFYFALEEYVLTQLLKNDETFFFTWEIHGVVIGKNQVIENEVNLNFLKENKIDATPTCIIKYSMTEAEKCVGTDEIWKGLTKFKSHLALTRK